MSPSLRYLTMICFWICILWGCKPGVPSEFIQPDDLEDILYDYHVADGMAFADGDYSQLSYRRTIYREAALRKHGLTEAEFDSSLVYYYRHADLLHDIYANLEKRLNNEAIALGATANELSQFGGMTSQGDTATVWRNESALMLMPQAPFNIVSFDVKADTAYHAGDKIILNFDSQFIFQDGVRDGYALLAVTFSNDSTSTQTMRVTSDQHFSMIIEDIRRLGIKETKGFIYLGKGNGNKSSTTLKLLAISNMRLLRMHTKKPVEDGEDEDSIANPNSQASMAVSRNIDPRRIEPEVHMHPQLPNEQDPNAVDKHGKPLPPPPNL